MPTKRTLKTTNNESEVSENMDWTDDEAQLQLETLINIKGQKSDQD